jgi:hypothetical protein
MFAKFEGACSECGARIAVGQEMWYENKTAYCMRCKPAAPQNGNAGGNGGYRSQPQNGNGQRAVQQAPAPQQQAQARPQNGYAAPPAGQPQMVLVPADLIDQLIDLVNAISSASVTQ